MICTAYFDCSQWLKPYLFKYLRLANNPKREIHGKLSFTFILNHIIFLNNSFQILAACHNVQRLLSNFFADIFRTVSGRQENFGDFLMLLDISVACLSTNVLSFVLCGLHTKIFSCFNKEI